MSIIRAPVLVINKLEQTQNKFLWEGVSEDHKIHHVNWEMVKIDKCKGSLGVLDMRSMNRSLLAKWVWRFATEINGWWRKLIETKYKSTVSEWQSVWEFSSAGVKFSSSFLRISASAQSLDTLLLTCVGDDGRLVYDVPLQFQLRGGALGECQEFIPFLADRLVPVVTMGPAIVIWTLHPSASFTVSSLVAELRRRLFPGLEEFSLRAIWKKEVPTKIQGFLWLVYHGKILTLDNLQ
ncbi:Putative ribonuclease H protein At1g65750, partial [Linum grandiflorum]